MDTTPERSASDPPERFLGLLITLAVLVAGTGLLEYSGRFLDRRILGVVAVLLLVQVLIAAVASVPTHKSGTTAAIRVLIAVTVGAQLMCSVTGWESLRIIAAFLALACVGYTIVVVLAFLMRCHRADANTIYAAVCVYLLMGIFWAVLYGAIDLLEPSAFVTSDNTRPGMGVGAGSATAIYYSFVTLTTLGYGDVLPVTASAKMAALLEAVVGQVFLVVLVARLVGLNVAHMPADGD